MPAKQGLKGQLQLSLISHIPLKRHCLP